MAQYERRHVEPTTERRWIRLGGLAAMLGGVVSAAAGLVQFFLLAAPEPALFDYIGPIEWILLPIGFLAYYASERDCFTRLATVGFWLVALATTGGFAMNAVANYTPSGVAFVGVLLSIPFTLIGALIFGVAMVRADAAPRLAAWLLIATPVGLFAAIAYTQIAAGIVAYPWAGARLCFGLAWVVLGYHLWLTAAGENADVTHTLSKRGRNLTG